MKMIKFMTGVLCLLPVVLKAQNSFTIQGQVGAKTNPSTIYLDYSQEGVEVKDSTALRNGQFSFKGKVNSPVEATVYIKQPGAAWPAPGDALTFYIENASITINAKDSLGKADVKGSKSNDDIRVLRAWQRPYRSTADSVIRIYNSRTAEQRKDTALTNTLSVPMRWAQAGYDSVNRMFINTHLHSFIALGVFRELELGYNFNPDTAAVRFARFPAGLRESAAGKKLAAMIETGKKTNTGAIAMDFALNDTTGHPVKLSDFRGHYVLLDFWASWLITMHPPLHDTISL